MSFLPLLIKYWKPALSALVLLIAFGTGWQAATERQRIKCERRIQDVKIEAATACQKSLTRQKEIADEYHQKLNDTLSARDRLLQRHRKTCVTVHRATCGSLSGAASAGADGAAAGIPAESLIIDYTQWQMERDTLRLFQRECRDVGKPER